MAAPLSRALLKVRDSGVSFQAERGDGHSVGLSPSRDVLCCAGVLGCWVEKFVMS